MKSKPTITAFEASPDRGRGLARDTIVRWALEEVGQEYDVRLVSFTQLKEPAHLAIHPFAKIPTFEDGTVSLFESGAIVLYLAETHNGLFPLDAGARGRAIAWMFAAVSTVEQPIIDLQNAVLTEKDKGWNAERLPIIKDRIRDRLAQLSKHLGASDWLEGEFTAGDLLMVSVLRRLVNSGLLAEYANVAALVARAETRPAFQRAFAAQLAVFNLHARTT